MVGLKLRKLVDLIYMYPFFFTLLPFPLFENWFDSKRKDKQMKRYREKDVMSSAWNAGQKT